MINLAVMYRRGTGTDKDNDQAFAWMKKAADKGSPLGQRLLAEFYYNGIGTDKNEQEAMKYYTLAAAQKEPVAVKFLKTRDPRLLRNDPL